MTVSKEENEIMTHVGRGTPCGDMMRRYWHPVAASADLDKNPTKRVRILGEDMVLYRDRSGTVGLIEPLCAHRRVNLFYGIPEEQGLRCPYHGWMYDETGQCIEQPFEQTVDPQSTFHEKVCLTAYPAQELGGLVWAYMGPAPVPLLPRWEPLIRADSIRDIGVTEIPCNFVQIMENSLDPVHVEYLHGALTDYSLEKQGKGRPQVPSRRTHEKIGFDVFEHGIIKRRMYKGGSEDDDEWRRGHPVLFPNILLVGSMNSANFQIRVPIDDDNTLHFFYTVNTPGIPVPPQGSPIVFDVPIPTEEDGVPKWELLDTAPGQDIIAWITQGSIARRELERLGHSDTGVILYRKLLMDNIDKVRQGEDPMNTFRDPAKNVSLALQTEHEHSARGGGPAAKYSPLTPEIRRLFDEANQQVAAPPMQTT